MIKLSDYVINYLEQLNVNHIFMIPGGGAMHLNDSLGNSEKIEYICCLNEQACSIAAEAYARVNNKLGMAMVTTGPGGTNAITGVAGGWIESTPMLIISGQVKIMDQIRNQNIRQMGMQEVDIVSIVRHITKYAVMITDPNKIKYHLDKAIYEATNGRKGPVWLDIPLDIQASMIDEENLQGYIPETNEFDEEELENKVKVVIEYINNSERPVILAGNGIRLSEAILEFRELIDELGIPVLTTWNGIDLIWDDHPLFFGRPGGVGQRAANFIQQNSDLFISIGARMNLLQTGYNFDSFARAAKKIMVDIDENELKKINVRPDLPIVSDAKKFIKLLIKNKNKIKKRERSNWIDYCSRLKEKYPIVLKQYWEEKEFVNSYVLLDVLSNEMKENDIFVIGSSGSGLDVSMQTFRVKNGQRVFSTKGLAAMGFGVPATIGACLASNNKRTVCVNGDGGFQMNIQELETIRRLNLPIKIFVINNNGYATIKATQTNVFKGHFVACDKESNLTIPNISDIAKAYKLKTVQIRNNCEVKTKVKEVLEYEGPVICEVFVSINQAIIPRQVSYKRKDGQMESKPLEYLRPEIDEEEFNENMIIPLYKEE